LALNLFLWPLAQFLQAFMVHEVTRAEEFAERRLRTFGELEE
jgi:hypothetical protein